ncbi:DUF7948 domain-containing protein [Taibaiella soli]|uniref:PKD domain-containing protein n=1 Tax=Taibaiella soli TaxID=1649169 RepID=A0A2W2AVY5_9BACT|nr:PKD domain-containing protein [Taibaiella soli]PZF72134.1 hypothetical protein DN068_14460 [Taibaiella soli]
MKKIYFLFSLLFCIPSLLQAVPAVNTPLEFIENRGQWDGPFRYKSVTGKGDVYLAENNFTYLIGDPSNKDRADAVKHGQVKGPEMLKFHAYRMYFDGAAKPAIKPGKEQSWYYNYFLGNDSTRWKTGIHPALMLDYTGLYPGVDMHVSSENNNLKYDFIIQPGTNTNIIRLRYEGADKLTIKNGNLVIGTSVGEVQEMKPYTYQYTDGGRKEIACRYVLKNDVITYDVTGDYDHTKPLIIDPTVVFCTFTGSTADNWGFTATYDNAGNFYAGGLVNGTGYPVSTGAFQISYGGGDYITGSEYACDMGIMKFNPTGTTKIWATYLGGNSNEQPQSMMVDASNNLVIAGRTYSHNFPVTATAYDTSMNGNADIVIIKLNTTATALIGSTYVGGSGNDCMNFDPSEYVYGNLKHNYGDDARSEVILDKQGNVYVTTSTNSTDFPTVNATQTTLQGGQDGVVIKMNPTLTSMIWGTYLGGTSDDAGYVLALDSAQTHLFVGGGTMSATGFPFTTGTYHSSYIGGTDGYIARFLNSGSYTLEKCTAIGTANYDQVYGLQMDMEDNLYAMGQSLGGVFPVVNAGYSNPNSSQFVIKMDKNLSTNIFSTVYGSGDPSHTNISPVAFLVDTCQNIYISGWGGNLAITQMPATIGTTTGMPITSNAAQSTTDGYDFYFIVLSKNVQSLLYGTYYGRYSLNAGYGEHVDGGTSRFDKSGVVYQAICANCGGSAGPAFPTTPGVYAPTDGSFNCNEAALKIAFQLGAVDAKAGANPNAKGCPPFTVHFVDSSLNATSYAWHFGDNTPVDTTFSPSHTYYAAGVYHAYLSIYNPNACKTRDTAYLTIVVDTNSVKSDFTAVVTDSCNPFNIALTNNSTYGTTPGAASFTKFIWYFGDGTSFNGLNPATHSYSSAGTYTVQLVMIDTTACNSPDTMSRTIVINNPLVKAGIDVPDSVCLKSGLIFTSTSTNASSLLWELGDDSTSALTSFSHTYATSGTYTVTLIASNPATCNKVDSVTKTVTIKTLPTADFSFAPVIPIPNTPVQFTNLSKDADIYAWNFGDGKVSGEVNPSHFYRKTGEYQVCLVARNNDGCADSVCKYVDAEIYTAADIPTGFSPNGDGNNDVLYVRGGAIETMDLKIFNRWGQLIFESTDLERGWDGTYQGKPQPIDAYAFVLNVTFVDGTSMQKKGNVTLLR